MSYLGCTFILPIANIATCGTTTTGATIVPPRLPTLLTVKVPPVSCPSVNVPAVAAACSAARPAATWWVGGGGSLIAK